MSRDVRGQHFGKRIGDNSLCPREIATRDQRVTSPKGGVDGARQKKSASLTCSSPCQRGRRRASSSRVPGSSRLRQPGRCSDGGAFNSRESHLARVGHSSTNRSVDAGYSSRCLGYSTTDLQMIVVCSNLRVAITAIGQGFRFAIKLAYVGLGLDQDQGRPTATCGPHDHLGARSLSRVAKPRSHWPSIA
jgi:hypothetical protein